MPETKGFKLCYISGPHAYFTTQELDEQYGDDWNDAPYEHNAGPPYLPLEQDVGEWEIDEIYFQGPFETPESIGNYNSKWSVQEINEKRVPWLTFDGWEKNPINGNWEKTKPDFLYAGASREEFIGFIKKHGGRVWIESFQDL